jgi:hypothetical protein
MRKGIYISPGVVRAAVLLTAIATIAIVVREIPELRRYIKAETM